MIAFLKGILEENRPGNIVIDVNGVGYNVTVAESVCENLPSIGNEIKVFTYLSVREDGMSSICLIFLSGFQAWALKAHRRFSA